MSSRLWFFRPRSTCLYNTSRHGLQFSRLQSTLAQAAAVAHDIVENIRGKETATLAEGVSVDPLRIVGKEMNFLTRNIQQLLGSGHPILDTVAKYYTSSEGKHIRPLLVLLMSRATAVIPRTSPTSFSSSPPSITQSNIDDPISPSPILADVNPAAPQRFPTLDSILASSATSTLDPAATRSSSSDILPSQRRLAEITELIHTASLLHDDVIDHSISRRNNPSANIQFGNKMAVLAGDFLLGRASVSLARLRNPEVIELLATVIANLVEGEFMQLKNTALDEREPVWRQEVLEYYLQKTYLKSASLISKSCRAAAILGGAEQQAVEAAYRYGKNLGLAFQLVDDLLDYTSPPCASSQQLGKPAGADLELGLATAPLLFTWERDPRLSALVGRKFAEAGDVQLARELVMGSDGLERTRRLAQRYADQAKDAVAGFPASEAKDGLEEMCDKVMKRKK